MKGPAEIPLLQSVGQRVRMLRQQRGMTQVELARESGVSVRFLGQLEGGEGNISVERLGQVAAALGVTPGGLLQSEAEAAAQGLLGELGELLQRHRPEEVRQALGVARALLLAPEGPRVALLGIRGAGKTAVGQRLARRLRVPFLELDTLVEKLAGLTLGAIFELHGEEYYRRLERQALLALLERPAFVVATGGSLVTVPEHYGLLKRCCSTVWLQARPEDHWARVVAQGDARPMRNKPRAMEELRALFAARAPLYEQAAIRVDTHGLGLDEVTEQVHGALAGLGWRA
jgi:XRE family aerobic/anaerobic benzoate catabolism transcriptional regulator